MSINPSKETIMENTNNLMTTTEAAAFLGYKRSYLYKLMMRRAVPYYKPSGKLCFFDREELDAWKRSCRIMPQDEIDEQAARYLADNDRHIGRRR